MSTCNKIAQATAGAVGADLANLVNEAALRAVRIGPQGRERRRTCSSPLRWSSPGTEKKGTVLTDMEKRIVSYHEVGHALVAALQKHAQPVSKITIVPHTSGALGYTMQMPEEEKFLSSKAGAPGRTADPAGRPRRRAGRLRRPRPPAPPTTSSGRRSLARKMVMQYGMSDRFGLMALSNDRQRVSRRPQLSQLRRYDRRCRR